MAQEDIMQQAHREYMESRILSAQPVTIIAMLYDVAVRSLKTALTSLQTGDAMTRAREVSRAQEAVNELMLALDHSAGASFSHSLAGLYAFAQQEILRGHTKQSAEGFRNALGVLTTLEEGWNGVREQVLGQTEAAPEPVYEIQEAKAPVNTRSTLLAEYQEPSSQESRDWNC